MRTSENKNSSARLTETENGNMMPPPTPGPALSRDTTEDPESQPETDLPDRSKA